MEVAGRASLRQSWARPGGGLPRRAGITDDQVESRAASLACVTGMIPWRRLVTY